MIGKAVLKTPLEEGYLLLASDLFLELPPSARTGVVRSLEPELQLRLLLALCAEKRFTEARAIQPLLDVKQRRRTGLAAALLKDVARFAMTGKRELDPWEAFVTYSSELYPTFWYEAFPLLAAYLPSYVDPLLARASRQYWARPISDAQLLARLDATRARAEKRHRAMWHDFPRAGGIEPQFFYGITPPDPPAPFIEVARSGSAKAARAREAPVRVSQGRFARAVEHTDAGVQILASSGNSQPAGTWLLQLTDGGSAPELYLGSAFVRGAHRPARL